MKRSRPIYTLDIETDPFKEGRFPIAFAIGFYDGKVFTYFWGSDCIARMRSHLDTVEPGIIYAHNGGRFDIFYCMDWIAGNKMQVINSRIIDAEIHAARGVHNFRDSYAIMPFALGSYKGSKQKIEIDITKLERNVRDKHRSEIIKYLKMDCELLHNLCVAFHQKFGDRLTIGSTAMKELKKFHTFENLNESWDDYIRGGKTEDGKIRQGYFYGGRVEYFGKTGVYDGDWKIYDVNSMYPHVMQSVNHPIGNVSKLGCEITPFTCFVKVEGKNYGAFPVRSRDGLSFNSEYGTFYVTIHEYNAAIRLGLFKLNKLHETIDFYEQGNFADFVDTYYGARKLAKSQNDVCNEMFYKLILNSCYGKFAQNPDRYEENCICISGWDNRPDGLACECITDNCKCGGWRIKEISTLFEDDSKNYWVWRRNSDNVYRFNVATGASITGASRAILMEAIQCAVRPIYCDTDCVICESLPLKIDGSNLGDWKLEGQGNRIAVAGKKLYTLLDNDKKRCRERLAENKKIELVGGYQCVKKANKGVQITSQDIVSVAMGETIESIKLAPTFSISGSHKFMRRNVHAT